MTDQPQTGRAWDNYTPIQKVGASLMVVVVLGILGGLMYVKWRMKFAPSEGQTVAREYAELVPQARDLARTVSDVPTAKAAGPKLKPMLDRIQVLEGQLRELRNNPDNRSEIDRDLGDAKLTAQDLQRDLARIQEKPEVWQAVSGQP
jgi:hypothetical protein